MNKQRKHNYLVFFLLLDGLTQHRIVHFSGNLHRQKYRFQCIFFLMKQNKSKVKIERALNKIRHYLLDFIIIEDKCIAFLFEIFATDSSIVDCMIWHFNFTSGARCT
jgi:hypothetical protein